jgi:hypothetical protein
MFHENLRPSWRWRGESPRANEINLRPSDSVVNQDVSNAFWTLERRIVVTLKQQGLPAALASGGVELDRRTYNNLLPLPHKSSGRVRIKLELATGEVIEIAGTEFDWNPLVKVGF